MFADAGITEAAHIWNGTKAYFLRWKHLNIFDFTAQKNNNSILHWSPLITLIIQNHADEANQAVPVFEGKREHNQRFWV